MVNSKYNNKYSGVKRYYYLVYMNKTFFFDMPVISAGQQ